MYVLLFHNSRLNQQSAISNQRSARELNHKGRKGMKVFGTWYFAASLSSVAF